MVVVVLSPPSQGKFRIHDGVFGDLTEFAVAVAFTCLHGVVGATDVEESMVVSGDGDSGIYNAGGLEMVEGVSGIMELCSMA